MIRNVTSVSVPSADDVERENIWGNIFTASDFILSALDFGESALDSNILPRMENYFYAHEIFAREAAPALLAMLDDADGFSSAVSSAGAICRY